MTTRSVESLIETLSRPDNSMLDDLGLEPALLWPAKEFSRRCDTCFLEY
jgi:hypothetical protein